MTDDRDFVMREKANGFFGAIIASLSHEINNVFAIINELSGLLDDFFQGAESGTPLKLERLRTTTRRIAVQVERGQVYVKRLNRFAHSVDDARSAFVLNESVEAITTLCQRFGVLRRVELETHLPETSPRIRGCPFDLQHVVFRCVEIVLEGSKQGDKVQIGIEAQGEGARLTFEGCTPLESVAALASKRDFLAMLVMELRGEVVSEIQAGEPIRLTVSLPHSLK